MAELADRVTALAAQVHAATAGLARLSADFEDSGDWFGVGMASCAHWLSVNAGVDLWTAGDLLRVGRALRQLPKISEAAAEGKLSFDKLRALVQVATPADEQLWLDVALQASGSQCTRICRAFRRASEADGDDQSLAHQRRRRLVTWWRDDGMLEIVATLPPEDGKIVLNAIQALQSRRQQRTQSADEPAIQPAAARRADALVRVCEEWLGSGSEGVEATRSQLVVHVDVDTLAGTGPGSRCHLDDGPAIAASAARRMACDAEVMTVVERDGVPVGAGRSKRVVTGRMRRLMQLRDGTCRYPGCLVPARDADGHHIKHWIEGGPTELSNLVSLCRFHHQRHHDGAFTMVAEPDGALRFRDAAGESIGPARAGAVDESNAGGAPPRTFAADAPRALDRGRHCDLEHTVWVLANHAARAAARDGPAA